MNQPASPRSLSFPDLDAVVREADALRVGGYVRAGQWDLAQVCGHVADWMRFPLDGFPQAPFPIGVILWIMRHTVARRQLRELLKTGSMRQGVPTLQTTVPPPNGDEAAVVAQLRRVAERFQTHTGHLHPSPLFGELDRDTALQLQLIHAAHHFSFLIPNNSAP